MDYNKKGEVIDIIKIVISKDHPAQQILRQYDREKRNVKNNY